MRVRGRTKLVLGAVLALAVCALTASAGTATGASSAVSSQVPKVGTGGPTTGAFTPWDGVTGEEFAAGEDEETADAYAGNIVDRSFARGGATVGVTTTTGECAQYAAAVEVTKLVIPGPFCAIHTPCLPDTRA